MSLEALWGWLENLPLAMYIGESWWFPLLESIHVLSGTFLVGAILMLDLRLLGLSGRIYPVSRISREIVPWGLAAAAISVVMGLGLFITRAAHYAQNPAFRIKVVLLVLAGANMAWFHLRTERGIAKWDTAAKATLAGRLAGGLSLLFWAGVMLSGRWIGHLN
jgi:hypothetical protein